jgi:hypothetical protein
MQLRYDLIGGGFGSRTLFHDHGCICEDKFITLADSLHGQINEIVKHQFALIEMDMEILKAKNVIEESERDPMFKGKVGAEVKRAKREIERLGRVVESDAQECTPRGQS